MARARSFDEENAVEQAMQVFWQRGYQGASLEHLLAATGLSKSSFYETFGTKRGLLLEALRRYLESSMGGLLEPLGRPNAGRAEIEETLAGMIRHASSPRGPRGCLVNNCVSEVAPHDAVVLKATRDARRQLELALERVIARGQRDGTITRTESAQALARFLANIFAGINLWGRSKPEAAVMQDVVRVALRALG